MSIEAMKINNGIARYSKLEVVAKARIGTMLSAALPQKIQIRAMLSPPNANAIGTPSPKKRIMPANSNEVTRPGSAIALIPLLAAFERRRL